MKFEFIGGPHDGEFFELPDGTHDVIVAETNETELGELLREINGEPATTESDLFTLWHIPIKKVARYKWRGIPWIIEPAYGRVSRSGRWVIHYIFAPPEWELLNYDRIVSWEARWHDRRR